MIIFFVSCFTIFPVSYSAEEVEVTENKDVQDASEGSNESLPSEETIEAETYEKNRVIDLAPVGAEQTIAEIGLESTGYSSLDNFINDYRFTDGASWAWNKGPILASFGSSGCCAYCADYVKYCFGINNPRSGSAFYSVSEIRAGDVLTVGNQSDGTGHWFVCLKRSGNSLYVAEGNYLNRVRIGWNYTISGSRFAEDNRSFTAGYHYLDGAPPIPKPSSPWFSANKSVAVTGDSVTFTFGANGATSYTIGIDKDGSRIITEGVSSGKSYTFDSEGTYSAYVTCYNSSGYVDSSRAEFKVFKPCNIGADFYAYIYHAKSDLAVGVDITKNVFLQYRRAEDDNQKWHFQRNTDGSYRITNVRQKKCLDVYGGTAAFGENIQVWEANDTNAQKWYIRHLSTGYAFVPKCNTSSAIDIDGGVFKAGTNIKDWRSNESAAQIFSIDYVGLEPTITKEYNGHRYELYNISTTWDQAYKMCEELGGHLVTITSKEENDFVLNLSKDAGLNQIMWLGAYANGDRNWFWVTDESFSYSNWHSGEPNNSGGNEDRLNMTESGTWNDIAVHANARMISFVCEYEDTIIDASQYKPSKTSLYNDSKYEFYTAAVTWKTAKAICEAKGGHLVIINNSDENTFVNNFAQTDIWMGITDNQKEGQWVDVFGKAIPYSNWADTQPDNHYMCENYGELYKNGTWNDHKNFAKLAFVCEYENATASLKPVVTKSFNGHKYELFDIHTSWNQAYKICENLGGHLVTVTTKEENDFVMNLSKDSVNKAIWLGGADYGSEGKWYWVTAELFSYTNWNSDSGEPNNTDENEHYMNMWTSGTWNDMPVNGGTNTLCFICEYEDFHVDEKSYSPVKTVLKNNTLYEFYESRVNWTTAKAICEQKGGHLITIDSKYENEIAISLISEEYAAWIGYTDFAKEGEWKDVFGNKATYSNWSEGEPNNHWSIENYAEIYKTGLWNDTKNFGSSFAKIGFICEYDNAITSIKPYKTFSELGHTYEIYTSKMSWKDAYRFCEKKGGHLVTINSQDEDKVVHEIQKTCSPYDRMWLGATDEFTEGSWKWITGETITYKNWADGEPNDDNDEDFMMMYKSSGKWNDVYDSTRSELYSYSFICEYDNQLDTSKYKVAKTFEYDGRKYEVYSNIVDWHTAYNLCKQKGGHLVTISSSDENSAIINSIKGLSNDRYWIGITDVGSEGEWNWVTGEAGAYSNWNSGEPNNDGGMEDYGEIIADSGKWNDMAGYYCIHRNIGFICEYETETSIILGDVDGDDIVTILDATAIQRHLASIPTVSYNEKAADADGDGSVSIIDATSIQRYLAQLSAPDGIGKVIKK